MLADTDGEDLDRLAAEYAALVITSFGDGSTSSAEEAAVKQAMSVFGVVASLPGGSLLSHIDSEVNAPQQG